MTFNGFHRVGRTRGIVTAVTGHHGTDGIPVKPDGKQYELSHHQIRYLGLAGGSIRSTGLAPQALPQLIENSVNGRILQVSETLTSKDNDIHGGQIMLLAKGFSYQTLNPVALDGKPQIFL